MEDLFDEEAVGESGGKERGESAEVPHDAEGIEVEESDLRGAAHRVLPDPGEPTAAEVEDHRACGHIPYRSWCSECVEARGVGEPHEKRSEQCTVCVFASCFLFISKDGTPMRRQDLTENHGEVDVKIFTAKDARGKAVFSHAIPQKGVDQDR